MEYLIVSILLTSLLIFYFNYHGHGRGGQKNASFPRINSFQSDPGQNIVWQRRGHVTPSSFALFHFRFHRRRHLESGTPPSSSILVCVEPEDYEAGNSSPRGDPDLYLDVANEYTNGVGYEADRHYASATSFGLDCVSLEWPVDGEGLEFSAQVGIYGYAPFPYPSSPIPYRLFVVTALEEVEVKEVTLTPILPTSGNDFEDDTQGGTGAGSFTNSPPPLAKRFVRRESGRKQNSEPVLWTILIGFLNILAEIL